MRVSHFHAPFGGMYLSAGGRISFGKNASGRGRRMEAIRYFEAEERPVLEKAFRAGATDVRVCTGVRPRILYGRREEIFSTVYTKERLLQLISRMLRHSLYAWEDELGEGFFTLEGGMRVGVSGRFSMRNGKVRLVSADSLLMRLAREVPGCAKDAVQEITKEGRIESALILSPPGMGKTTILRDMAREFSGRGYRVAVADERYEIAARHLGSGLDVGERTDVADGLLKHLLIQRLLRSMAPEILITDEIGRDEDAQAVADACRTGVNVIASAHAGSLEDALGRNCLSGMLREGAFNCVIVLGGAIGSIRRVHRCVFSEGAWRFD